MHRKLFHLSGLVFPVIAALFSVKAALAVSGSFLFLITSFDAVRMVSPGFNSRVFSAFRPFFKPGEYSSFSGSPYFMGGVFFSLLLFEPGAAAGGIIYLSIGDMSAVLIGERFGKHKLFGKSLEGSAGFIVITFLVLSGLSYSGVLDIGILPALAGSVVCAAVELLPLKVDDNLLIPLAGSGVLAALG